MTYTVMGVTGNRPHKLPPGNESKVREYLHNKLQSFQEQGGEMLIQGGAAGVDIWAAEAALELELDVANYLPFPPNDGPNSPWGSKDLDLLSTVRSEVVNEKIFGQSFNKNWYFVRNRAIVDDCDILLCVHSAKCNTGGAIYTKTYAITSNVPVLEVLVFDDRITERFHPARADM